MSQRTGLVRWSFAGTHSGPLGEAPPTGRRVLVTGMHLMRFSAGRISQTHASWDVRGLERQLAPDPAETPPPSPRSHRGAP